MEDIEAVNEAKADYAGFVFFEKSKRNISPDTAVKLLQKLDPGIFSVAVCVSPTMEDLKIYTSMGFDRIQIHGTIPQDALGDGGIPLWQAINISGGIQTESFLHHKKIQGYVVDGATYGGGKTFGWETQDPSIQEIPKLLKAAVGNQPLILAGGLNENNCLQGIQIFSPDIVDVSSGVETNGRKDKQKIKDFIRKVREQ
jgi:phosphoribosylanthranilate isomerase